MGSSGRSNFNTVPRNESNGEPTMKLVNELRDEP
jgi:hypothetical protein